MKKKYNLHLKGYVGGYDFDRNYVDYVLAQNTEKEVNVLIDSLGGSLATALSIAASFDNHGSVAVHFVGMNASAATIASLGAKHISIDSSAMYLVHKCSSEIFQYGNLNADDLDTLIKDLKATKNDLDKLDSNIAEMYAAKCKKSAASLLSLMKVGGWLTAKEALDWGFVDEITDFDYDAEPQLTTAVASAMAAIGMPIPNIPVADSQSTFAKLISSITDLFKANAQNKDDKQPQSSTHKFDNLGILLKIESFVGSDNNFTLTLDQMQNIESALVENKNQQEKMQNEINELRKSPADFTSHVVNDKKQKNGDSSVDSFVETVNSALELFRSTPKL